MENVIGKLKFFHIEKCRPKKYEDVILIIEHKKNKEVSLIKGYKLELFGKDFFCVRFHEDEGKRSSVARMLNVDPTIISEALGLEIQIDHNWRVIGWSPILAIAED